MEMFGIFISFEYIIGFGFLALAVGFVLLHRSIEKNSRPSPKKWDSIIDPVEKAKVDEKGLHGRPRGF